MSEKSWDDEDVEVPPPLPPSKTVDDRWAGEDEERVKDNWDDDEEEKRPAPVAVSAVPRKKTKKQIIAEKQAQKEAELKAKRLEIERMNSEMTPEERIAEKLRLQKVQEESDLQFAVDMMGIKESDSTPQIQSLQDADISTAEGLEALGSAMVSKIRSTDRLEKKAFYVPFLETFCKDLCFNLEVDELKKVTQVLNALSNEKVKASKPVKGKKKGGKQKIHIGKEEDVVDGDRYIDDMDDFI